MMQQPIISLVFFDNADPIMIQHFQNMVQPFGLNRIRRDLAVDLIQQELTRYTSDCNIAVHVAAHVDFSGNGGLNDCRST